jgi:lipopolysaccharide cholinephosphotransferase
MFNEDKTVAAAQKVMLEILVEIHRICEENNITYWLDAGTLLGAIRHKGFIPWDDDCDVAMPRKDYEKFLKIAQEKLPKDMFLQTKSTEREYPLPWAKIRKNGTLLIETGETGKENYHHGVFVDIFPCDYYESADIIKKLQWARRTKDEKNKYSKGSLKRILLGLYANIFLYIPIHNIEKKRKYLVEHRDEFNNKYNKYLTYSADIGDAFVTKVDDILPVKLTSCIFENKTFYTPNKSADVLRAMFGDNYMELPPLNQRKTHARQIKL